MTEEINEGELLPSPNMLLLVLKTLPGLSSMKKKNK